MVILRFDLRFDLVTYLFDLDLTTVIYPCEVLYYICGPRLVMISPKTSTSISEILNSDTFHFKNEYKRLRLGGHTVMHRPPDQCQNTFLRQFSLIFPNFWSKLAYPETFTNFQMACRL